MMKSIKDLERILRHQNMFIVQLIELCPSFDSYKKRTFYDTHFNDKTLTRAFIIRKCSGKISKITHI